MKTKIRQILDTLVLALALLITPKPRLFFAQTAMIFVEGGEFTMGCTPEQSDDCFANESPAHSVKLESYYIGQYEVTQEDWERVMGDSPSYNGACMHCPVEYIDWYSMIVFCNEQTMLDPFLGPDYRVYYKDKALTKPWELTDYNGNGDTGFGAVYRDMSKAGYRLPTEAEWEFAARGGTKSRGYKYSGSDNVDDVAWYYGNSGKNTNIVGGKYDNELEIYDMSGNVWEWVWDWWSRYDDPRPRDTEWNNFGSGRVRRGGFYAYSSLGCRVSFRNKFDPTHRNYFVGFRLAQNQ